MKGKRQKTFQEIVEFIFSEVIKPSAESRVKKWKISTLQLLMRLRNSALLFRQLECVLLLQKI